MNLWSVEHFLIIISFTLFNVLITGESNFDEKMSKKCSTDQDPTDQRFIRKRNTTYKIRTLVSPYTYFKVLVLQNINSPFIYRIGGDKQAMTPAIRSKIMSTAIEYGTGASTLRCLALATCDNPMNPNEMDLEESTKFVKYEQDLTFVGVVGKFFFKSFLKFSLSK